MITELNIDLDNISPDICQEVFETLKKDLVVVIKRQSTDAYKFARLVYSMSHIANWQQLTWDTDGNYIGSPKEYPNPWEQENFPVQRVTGEQKEGEYTGIFPVGKLDWHSNLNGPTRADGVALQGIHGVEGTTTSWLNTSVALKEMPEELYNRLKDKHCSYYYNMENWSDIKNKKQLEFMRKNREEYKMFILQENIAGTKGLYFYVNNDLKVEGDEDLLFDLQEYLFQEKFIYHHQWEVGDIVLSDQLLTLHKRQLREDSIFEKRLLHRLTFPISNQSENFILENNRV